MTDDKEKTDPPAEEDADWEAERERILEQARRENPALREQAARGLAALRRIAER
jgi:hypothetical protein